MPNLSEEEPTTQEDCTAQQGSTKVQACGKATQASQCPSAAKTIADEEGDASSCGK